MSLDILLVEDNPVDELAVRAMLVNGPGPAGVRSCHTLAEAVEAIGEGRAPDVAVLDLHLPDATGTGIVATVRETVPDAAVVVLTASGDELGTDSLHGGAHQYLPKRDLQADRLWRTIEAAQATAKVQHDLAAAIRDRDRLVDDLEELLSIVAHDLRAPLRTARLYADRLLDDPARQGMWGRRLDGSLGRMDEMVQALLEYGQMGRTVAQPTVIDLADLGDTVAQDLHHDLDDADGELRWDAAGTVRCDCAMLRQVLSNLVLNGLRYRVADRAPRIVVDAQALQVTTTITVTDNGRGIASGHWEQIFRPFERLSNDDEGLGLGLAACRRLLELNGGDLHVSRSDRTGTTMRLVLPGA
ncbi:MAG: ATP-binding protein [Actinomycetota bacterium]